MANWLLYAAALGLVASGAASAHAQDASSVAQPATETPERVVLEADYIYEIQEENSIVAEGNVEALYEARVLRADRIVYNKTTDRVRATGNVVIVDTDGSQQFADEIEVNSYITEHPEAAKYKPVMMKYLAHPTYKNIPVKNIAAIVMSGEMQKIGAAKERAAQKKVLESKGGNGSHVRTPAGGAKDYAKLSDKEMEAEIAKAKGMTG